MIQLSRRSLLAGLTSSFAATLAAPTLLMANPRPSARPERGRAKSVQPLTTDELIAKASLGAAVAFLALDASSGAVIESREADLPLPPASTLKSVTALYALAKLGAGHRFSTRVLRAGDLLILAGGGDPELDSGALAKLAKNVAAAEKAAGRPAPARFAVWGGALPHIAEIAPGQAVHLPYNPTLSGMILNFNRVHLGWRRGEGGYALTLEARGAGQSPRAYTISAGVADRRAPLFTYDGSGKTENWSIASAGLGKAGTRWLPVRRPELYAGDAFQTFARAAGLVLPAPEVIESLPEATEIASHVSAPLDQILRGMMEYSNNLTAEVVGLTASGKSDLRASAQEMEAWLRGFGITGAFAFHDHSGLSPQSRITARMMAETLAGPGRKDGVQALMKRIAPRDAKGKPLQDSRLVVEAKTGTLNFVSNLAGYAGEDAADAVIFAVLTGDEARRAATEGRELPDGVIGWTRRSKALQQGLIESWVAKANVAKMAAPEAAPALEPHPGATGETLSAPEPAIGSDDPVPGAG